MKTSFLEPSVLRTGTWTHCILGRDSLSQDAGEGSDAHELKEREGEGASRLSSIRSLNLALERAGMGCPVPEAVGFGAHLERAGLETGN